MLNAEGFILVGGASSRMGRDKSSLDLGEKHFVERIADALAGTTQRVLLVGRQRDSPDRAPQTTQRTEVEDIYPAWGALGGLHAALNACLSEWAVVVACDLPFVSTLLLERLALFRKDFDAVVPIQPDGRVQPLCALYRCAPCLLVAERLIASGERRPRALLDAVNARRVNFSEVADLDGASRFFENINTPDDYARAQRIVSGDAEQVI